MYAPFPTTAQEHLKRIFPRLIVLPPPPRLEPAHLLLLPAPAAPIALLPAITGDNPLHDTIVRIERVTKHQKHRIIPKKMRPPASKYEALIAHTARGRTITLHEEGPQLAMLDAAGADRSVESCMSVDVLVRPPFIGKSAELLAVRSPSGWIQQADRRAIRAGDTLIVNGITRTVASFEDTWTKIMLRFEDGSEPVNATSILVKLFAMRQRAQVKLHAHQVSCGMRIRTPGFDGRTITVQRITVRHEYIPHPRGGHTHVERYHFSGVGADGEPVERSVDRTTMLDVEVH